MPCGEVSRANGEAQPTVTLQPTVVLEWIRRIGVAVIALQALFFLDAPFLTLGQKRATWRWREQVVINSLELTLVLWWVMAKWLLGWERPLVPAGAALAAGCAGLALVLGGAGLLVWAKLRLGRWFVAGFMIKDGHELVTGGPYAITRHPIYTGLLAAFAGAALLWNSALTLALAAGFVVSLSLHTMVEEALLERHFGDAYRAYRARVPRLVPFAGPGRKRG
jgi:protein-S-isoprenylcysteine O-methyltransferase Ste14